MMDCFPDYLADNSLIEMSQRLIFPYAQHRIVLIWCIRRKRNTTIANTRYFNIFIYMLMLYQIALFLCSVLLYCKWFAFIYIYKKNVKRLQESLYAYAYMLVHVCSKTGASSYIHICMYIHHIFCKYVICVM